MIKDLKNKKKEDLMELLSEKRTALRNFRFAISGSKQKNVREGRGVRKDIARIMTEINNEK